MNPELPALLVAALGFVVALVVAKLVTGRSRRRKQLEQQKAQRLAQSRQVRRARERKGH